MGLSGPKKKQRIGSDPRNLAWSNDQSKFGLKMMKNMGWTPGKGLGANESGIVKHVSMTLKEDKAGVGSQGDSSDSWQGNSNGYSELLERMNKRLAQSASASASASPRQVIVEETAIVKTSATDDTTSFKSDEKSKTKDKKRKRDQEVEAEEPKKKPKKSDANAEKFNTDETTNKPSKKEKKDKSKTASDKESKADKKKRKAEKKSKKSKKSKKDLEPVMEVLETVVSATAASQPAGSSRNAARHKFLMAKRSATQSGMHLNEILGIKFGTGTPPTPSTDPGTPLMVARAGLGANLSTAPESLKDSGVQITTEKVSTEEYFARRLAALAERDRASGGQGDQGGHSGYGGRGGRGGHRGSRGGRRWQS